MQNQRYERRVFIIPDSVNRLNFTEKLQLAEAGGGHPIGVLFGARGATASGGLYKCAKAEALVGKRDHAPIAAWQVRSTKRGLVVATKLGEQRI